MNKIYLRILIAVNDELISAIGRGFCILIGICKDDTKSDVDYL